MSIRLTEYSPVYPAVMGPSESTAVSTSMRPRYLAIPTNVSVFAIQIQTLTRYWLPSRTMVPQETRATTRDSLTLYLNPNTFSQSCLLAIMRAPNVLRPRQCRYRTQNRKIGEQLWPHHPPGRHRTRAPQNQLPHQSSIKCDAITREHTTDTRP